MGGSGASVDWEAAVGRALADAGAIAMVFQPVVDLRRGTVAGYEALARFTGPPDAPPDRWFREAALLGADATLEARSVACALAARPALPANCFLSVNVNPRLLDDPEVRAVLDAAGDLSSVVVELTEHEPVADYDRLARGVERLKRAGAVVAVDDAGAGYASLSHILALRPSFVKVDRAIVEDVDRDGGKLALVEMLGTFASRIDAWIVAEGVERPGELDALCRLAVPLAQGWLLGRPGPGWPPVAEGVADQLAVRRRARTGSTVSALIEPAPTAVAAGSFAGFVADPKLDWLVSVDEDGRPTGVRHREDLGPRPVMRVAPTADVAAVARRAMARGPRQRFDPLVVCNERGDYRGIVRVERLVEWLTAG